MIAEGNPSSFCRAAHFWARGPEKFVNPELTKVNVMGNGVPIMLYTNGIDIKDMWEKVSGNFIKDKTKVS